MPRITEIKRQKRQAERVSVFLDGEFWTGMSMDLMLELGLRSGADLTEERKREIETLVVEDKALAGRSSGSPSARSPKPSCARSWLLASTARR